MTKILGLDPGLRITGWGIIDITGNSLRHIAHGTVSSNSKDTLSKRLDQLYQALGHIIDQYQPNEAAVEETFVNNNPKSTLKLGEARGVVLLAPAHKGLVVSEYATNRVKKTVVGVGHADKNQVITMVNYLLPNCGELTADSADALAVAICHHSYRRAWSQFSHQK